MNINSEQFDNFKKLARLASNKTSSISPSTK